jgi:hypothetical protein
MDSLKGITIYEIGYNWDPSSKYVAFEQNSQRRFGLGLEDLFPMGVPILLDPVRSSARDEISDYIAKVRSNKINVSLLTPADFPEGSNIGYLLGEVGLLTTSFKHSHGSSKSGQQVQACQLFRLNLNNESA